MPPAGLLLLLLLGGMPADAGEGTGLLLPLLLLYNGDVGVVGPRDAAREPVAATRPQ